MAQEMKIIVTALLLAAAAHGQTASNSPHIGYLYPAGGQTGTVVRVAVGGQFLRGSSAVHVTGSHVHARVIAPMTAARLPLAQDQRSELSRRIQLRRAALLELPPPETAAAPAEGVTLPNHPLWHDLDTMNLRELVHLASILSIPRQRLQSNRQIAESVLIEVTIEPQAALGCRELRLVTPAGLTNPINFQVGLLPEIREQEPNNHSAYDKPLRLGGFGDVPDMETETLELPVLINGQIMPGDTDRFRFRAEKGQQIVIAAHARSLIPYLADAVPGWFQAVVTLYDAGGTEVAYADDYRFHPDPVLCYSIPEDGAYELQIRDAIYRGREDFVYRIAVGELPFITQIFPLGAQADARAFAAVDGWNIPAASLALNTQNPGPSHETVWQAPEQRSNVVLYAVDTLPECFEIEPNDSPENAQAVTVPVIINGRIAFAGDRDVFSVEGKAGDTLAIEVTARRLNSPLDSLVRLSDAAGAVLAWNDDDVVADNYLYREITGVQTHAADSYLTMTLPEDGRYAISLTDAQGRGDPAFGYRLRISPPRPDFALRMTPSSLNVAAGGVTEFDVHVLRRDGFDGDIDIVLKDPPAGFVLRAATVGAGKDAARLTLAAPRTALPEPVVLRLEGRARVGTEVVRRPVVAAEEMMQAFLYRHLVPSQELVVLVQRPRRPPAPQAAQAR